MNVYNDIKTDILKELSKIWPIDEMVKNSLIVESAKLKKYDLATNAAFLMAKFLKVTPLQIGERIILLLKNIEYLAIVEIAKTGFINFILKQSFWRKKLQNILDNETYGLANIGQQQKVNIEYVSSNPTGPIHIGHTRGAVTGDIVANLLSLSGFDVTREFYINDAGVQISHLIQSVYDRYRAIIDNTVLSTTFYKGKYIQNIAQNICDIYGKNLGINDPIFKRETISQIMNSIKIDLKKLNVHHDIFISEQSLHDQNILTTVIEILKKQNLIYYGTLPPPQTKGTNIKNWTSEKLLLFKTTAFADTQDRVLKKPDGYHTYFASELAYIYHKIQRDYDILIMELGHDHIGSIPRLKAAVQALSQKKIELKIKIHQVVNFIKNGNKMPMSKREGNFTTLDQLIKEIGVSATRFMIIHMKSEHVLNLDLNIVKETSKDNPVFYVQYAYVRVNSLLNKIPYNLQGANLDLLKHDCEIKLIQEMMIWPHLICSVTKSFELQKITHYMYSLSSNFHALWNININNTQYRFISDDHEITKARLSLAIAVKKILKTGFDILGIVPLEKM